MRIVLEVKKERFTFFIELIRSLGFVKVINDQELAHKHEGTNDLEEALQDVQLHQLGKKKLKTLEAFLDEA